MAYIHSRNIIHADLAARNILLDIQARNDGKTAFYVKIADFGLSTLSERGSYTSKHERPIPVRHSAIEGMNNGRS